MHDSRKRPDCMDAPKFLNSLN